LFAKRGGANDEQAAFFFRPELAEDEAGLDGFAQADLVGEKHAFDGGRTKKVEGGLDLVRVQVNGGVKKGSAELVYSLGGVAG
jgi:hypothetical protein